MTTLTRRGLMAGTAALPALSGSAPISDDRLSLQSRGIAKRMSHMLRCSTTGTAGTKTRRRNLRGQQGTPKLRPLMCS